MRTLGLLYQKHAESFPHDAVEQVEGGVSSDHEEVAQEEEFSAAVVQQSVVLAAKQRLIGILADTERAKFKKGYIRTTFFITENLLMQKFVSLKTKKDKPNFIYKVLFLQKYQT